MDNFFKLKVRPVRCLMAVMVGSFVLPYLAALLPCGGTAEQIWLDAVIARVEQLRDNCNDPELRHVLDYTARRYRKVGPYGVQIRYCGPWAAALNVPHCPGVTIDPEVIDYSMNLGVTVLVHEARHDYFPYFGHTHFEGLIPSFLGETDTVLERLQLAERSTESDQYLQSEGPR